MNTLSGFGKRPVYIDTIIKLKDANNLSGLANWVTQVYAKPLFVSTF